MLNLDQLVRGLTQGQPAAEMTLIAPPAAAMGNGEPATEPSRPVAPASQPTPSIDAHAVANRVYDLMCDELALTRDRCGRRRW